MAYADPAEGKRRDRARFRRRTEERIAAGLCPRCGKTEPLPERTVCAACAEKRNRAARARDARLSATGKPRRDPGKARLSERRRARRRAAKQREAGLYVRCGKAPAAPDRAECAPCSAGRREAERRRYAKAIAEGRRYAGRDIEAKRKAARAASKRRRVKRLEAGACTRCGTRPPVEGGTTCQPCRGKRQAAERRRYERRRAAGLCGKCGGPTTDGGARCAPCAAIETGRDAGKKNAASRRRYAERRARDACTDCGARAFGACRCPECAKRSYERSAYVRVMPVYPPSFAVFLRGADEPLATFDDEMEVAAFLAFEKLGRDQVEVVADAPPVLSWAAWD